MRSPVFLSSAFSLALVLSLLGFMVPSAVLDDIVRDRGLSTAGAGWLGGALFVGYVAAVPILTAWTGRVDPRRIHLDCAIGNIGFSLAGTQGRRISMNQREYPAMPVCGAGGVCFKREYVLLVRLAKPPITRHWPIPGGGQERGGRPVPLRFGNSERKPA